MIIFLMIFLMVVIRGLLSYHRRKIQAWQVHLVLGYCHFPIAEIDGAAEAYDPLCAGPRKSLHPNAFHNWSRSRLT